MTSKHKALLNITNDWAHSTVFCDDSFFDVGLNKNCVAFNNYAVSVGADKYKQHYKVWHKSLKLDNFKIIDSLCYDGTIACHMRFDAKHTGHFKGITPTGKTLEIHSMVNISVNKCKIVRIFANVNIEDIIGQLVPKQTEAYRKAIDFPIFEDRRKSYFNQTILLLKSLDIKLTLRQLECLCLWYSGKCNREIGLLLRLSVNTINCYQAQLRSIFKCSKKQQIFEYLENADIETIINECFLLICNGKILTKPTGA